MRRRHCLLALAVLAASAAGCSRRESGPGVATPAGTAIGPHGSNAVPLPNSAGYVELLGEVPAGGKGDPLVVAYVYGPDLKAPLASPPADLKCVVAGVEYPFKPQDPSAKPPKLAAGPAPVDPDRFAGELTGTLAGQTFRVPFTVGQ